MQDEPKPQQSLQDKKNIGSGHLKAPLLKIILIGDSGVGKTTLIHSFVNNGKLKEEFKQSVGIDYIMKKIEIGSKVNIRFEIVTILRITYLIVGYCRK